MATRSPTPRWLVRYGAVDCFCRKDFGPTANPGRYCAEKCSGIHPPNATGSGRPTSPNSKPPTAVSGICAVIDYVTKYCLAITVTPTGRGIDALHCLQRAVTEAQRLLGLDDLRADRGVMDILDANDTVIGQAPAPIAVVSDNGPCFRGKTFQTAFSGQDPLLRHVRTRIESPQTNGVVERFFGSLKYEHLFRGY